MTGTDGELYRRFLNAVPIGMSIWHLDEPKQDSSLRLVFANEVASKLVGKELAPFFGKTMLEAFPSVTPERMGIMADVARTGTMKDLGAVLYSDAERTRTFTVRAVAGPDQHVISLFDLLEPYQQATAKAREAERFLDSIIENLPAMIFVKSARELRFERFNRAGEELLGLSRDNLIGKNDYDFFPKDQADFFTAKDRKVLSGKRLEDILEEPIQTPRGTRWLHTRKIPILGEDGEPNHLLGVSIDITERKQAAALLEAAHEDLEKRYADEGEKLKEETEYRRKVEEDLRKTEEQLRQSQKMEAIGRLAGGVAHDFNNQLSVVLSYCDIMLQDLHSSDPMRADVEEVRRAGAKAAELTKQLLAFSRQQVLQPRILDLNEIVEPMQRMLPRILGEDIALSFKPTSGLRMVKVDPTQVEQVIMNLVVNARDAMPTGGQLTIETSNVELDDTFVATHIGGLPGPHVMLAVSDTGHGMDKETIARMFEPFFTTKDVGKGTGLGLSTVFGIVKQSGGSIWVYSEPGKGATFKIYFPESKDAMPVRARVARPALELSGGETILLVEDDAQVRTLTKNILKRHGYRVLEAGLPSEALLISADPANRIQLLLTDVVMPEMGGRLLAAEVLKTRPELKVIFMSGYTDDAVVSHGVLEQGVAFLQKPLTPETILRRVRNVLDD